ncbi:MAG TPA: hypothetical protein VN453_06600 [Feifaniaceae bacterium]|nr:hypothetical protein [Feifaniaceae bacterium]
MRILYQNTLQLSLPFGWVTEEGENSLACYHPNGAGALTVSLHAVETGGETLESYLKVLAERYSKKCVVKITRVLLVSHLRHKLLASSGEGITSDGWHAAFWFVSNGRQIATFTYLAKEHTREWYKAAAIVRRAIFLRSNEI